MWGFSLARVIPIPAAIVPCLFGDQQITEQGWRSRSKIIASKSVSSGPKIYALGWVCHLFPVSWPDVKASHLGPPSLTHLHHLDHHLGRDGASAILNTCPLPCLHGSCHRDICWGLFFLYFQWSVEHWLLAVVEVTKPPISLCRGLTSSSTVKVVVLGDNLQACCWLLRRKQECPLVFVKAFSSTVKLVV